MEYTIKNLKSELATFRHLLEKGLLDMAGYRRNVARVLLEIELCGGAA